MECYEVYALESIEPIDAYLRIQRHFLTSIVRYKYLGIVTSSLLKSLGISGSGTEIRLDNKDLISKVLKVMGIEIKTPVLVFRKSRC